MKVAQEEQIDSIEDLIEQCFDDVKDNIDAYPHFIHAAIVSQQQGYNSSMWVKMAEAIMKSYVLQNPDSRIISDQFILGLASRLSLFFKQQVN